MSNYYCNYHMIIYCKYCNNNDNLLNNTNMCEYCYDDLSLESICNKCDNKYNLYNYNSKPKICNYYIKNINKIKKNIKKYLKSTKFNFKNV
jgi:hypothetical protein